MRACSVHRLELLKENKPVNEILAEESFLTLRMTLTAVNKSIELQCIHEEALLEVCKLFVNSNLAKCKIMSSSVEITIA